MNNNRNVSTFSPFITYCQHVIPLAYDESMSYYETLCALRDYLVNTVIPAVNNNANAVTELQNAFETLQNYIDNYFKNLDVQTEINNKLDEMASDGSLAKIINEEIFNDLNNKIDELDNNKVDINSPKSNNISLQRVYRDLTKINLKNFNDYQEGNFDYAGVQGITYINNNKIIWGRRSTESQNINKLEEIDLTTGQILRTSLIDCGHCNSITYNSKTNQIIIPKSWVWNNGVEQDSNDVVIINYDTLTMSAIKTLPFVPYSISYNEENDNYVIINAIGEARTVYIYDGNLENMIKSYNMNDNDLLLGTLQGACSNNNLFTLVTSGVNEILFYDLEGNKVINYSPTQFNHEGNFLGEIEDITYMGNGEYLISSNNKANIRYSMPQIFKFNVLKNVIDTEHDNTSTISDNQDFYVDINSTSKNPDGTINRPFKYINEVNCMIQNCKRYPIIHVAHGTYPFTQFEGISKFRIDFDEGASVNGLELYNGDNIQITEGVFNATERTDHASLVIQRCDISLYTPTITASNGYGMNIDGCSTVNFSGDGTFNLQSNDIAMRIGTSCTVNRFEINNNKTPIETVSRSSNYNDVKLDNITNGGIYYGPIPMSNLNKIDFYDFQYIKIYYTHVTNAVKCIIVPRSSYGNFYIQDTFSTTSIRIGTCQLDIDNSNKSISIVSSYYSKTENGKTTQTTKTDNNADIDAIKIVEIYGCTR